jgi:PE family
MSFVSTKPAALAATAGELTGLRSTMVGSSAAAAPMTTSVLPAAADEVSALTASSSAGIVKLSEVGAVANHISLMRHI